MQASAVDGFSSSILKRSCLDLAALHQLSAVDGFSSSNLSCFYLLYAFWEPLFLSDGIQVA